MRLALVLIALLTVVVTALLQSDATSFGLENGSAVSTKPLATSDASHSDARLYFIWPNDGAVISSGKLLVHMAALDAVVAPKSSHYHLLIDTELPSPSMSIPDNRNYLHLDAGETSVAIELAPGLHTLQLLLGDTNDLPHHPPLVSRKITVRVR